MKRAAKHLIKGEMLTVKQAMKKHGSTVKIATVRSRIKRGMSLCDALTQRKGLHGSERPAHHREYCHQDGECDSYSECGGKIYKKKVQCFIKERYCSGVQGISSECTINL